MKKRCIFSLLAFFVLLAFSCTKPKEHNILEIHSQGYTMHSFTYPKKWNGEYDYSHREWCSKYIEVSTVYTFDFTIDSLYENGRGKGKIYKVSTDGDMVSVRVNNGYTYMFPEEFMYNFFSGNMIVRSTNYDESYWIEDVTSIYSTIDMNNFWR